MAVSRVPLDKILAPYSHSVDRILYPSPNLIRSYASVVCCLEKKGYVPLVHGRSQGWAVMSAFRRALGYQGIEQLRHFDKDLMGSTETLMMDLQKRAEEDQKQDLRNRFLRKFFHARQSYQDAFEALDGKKHGQSLLATTVGICHETALESPMSFVGGSIRETIYGCVPSVEFLGLPNYSLLNVEKAAFQIIEKMRKEKPYFQVEDAAKTTFSLIQEANTLPMGDLVIIALPKALASRTDCVYVSRPYGRVATLSPLSKEIEKISFISQVRLIMGKPLLNHANEIIVVSCSDAEQIEPYEKEANNDAGCKDLQAFIKEFFRVKKEVSLVEAQAKSLSFDEKRWEEVRSFTAKTNASMSRLVRKPML